MKRYLLDVNTVLALLDPRHIFHEAAHRWAERHGNVRWLTSPLVQNAVIRVASQPSYPNHLGTVAAIRDVLGDFCAGPRHEFCPDDISLLEISTIVRADLLTPSRVTDIYLLALAQHHDAKLATFDRTIPVEALANGAAALEILEG